MGARVAEPDEMDITAGEQESLFEAVVGGKEPTSLKVRLLGGAIEIPMPEGGIKKGDSFSLQVNVVARGTAYDDQEDDKTQQVIGCVETRKLKIRGASILEKPERS